MLGRTVLAGDLTSLEETDRLRELASRVERSPSWKLKVGFEERTGQRFCKMLEHFGVCQSEVHLWTKLSNHCGLMPPVSLSEIRFDFEFGAVPDGVIVVLGVDYQHSLLLEFSADGGERYLEMEIEGSRWGRLEY